MNMQIKVNGFTYEFFPATMNGVEVIGISISNGTESHTEWSAEPTRLPTSEEEAREYFTYSWQIVDNHDDFRAATIAEQFAARFDDDGAHWIDKDGHSFAAVLDTMYVVRTDTDASQELTRHEFRDGSAIVEGNSGWDIEGSTPFSWRSLEEA